jgi:excisionase family DNA binding protein
MSTQDTARLSLQSNEIAFRRQKMAITVTLKRASEESGLSIRTIHYKIAQGLLPSIKVGKRRLISERALREFLLGKQPNK